MRRAVLAVAASVVVFAIAAGAFQIYESKRRHAEEADVNLIARQIVSEMAWPAVISQLLLVYTPLDELKMIRQHLPGSIFVFLTNIPTYPDSEVHDVDLLRRQIEQANAVYRKSGLPLPLYAIDQEGGHVKRLNKGVTLFPSAMAVREAIAAGGKASLAAHVAFHTCDQLRSIGIQWNLAPVLDVQNNPENPVIRTRSYSSEPQMVQKLGELYNQGLYRGRCVGSAKHFPGHGNTSRDSHLELPAIDAPASEMEDTELLPFRELVDSRYPPQSIMSAHIVYRQLDSKPATISHYWLTKKLRDEWGFNGVIITDELGMKGISNALPGAKAKQQDTALFIAALSAGADVLLILKDHEERIAVFKKAITTALKANQISRDALVAKATRVVAMKVRIGLLDSMITGRASRWPQPERDAATRVLLRSGELDAARRAWRQQIPAPEKLNRQISRAAIKALHLGRDFVRQRQKPMLVYTDIDEGDPSHHRLRAASSAVRALQDLAADSAEDLVIIHTDQGNKNEFRSWLKAKSAQKKSNWLIYTNVSPFPYGELGGWLSSGDSLIVSFSDTPESTSALIEAYVEKRVPEMAQVKYGRSR